MSALKTAGLTFSVFQGQGMPPSRPETGGEEKLSRDTRSGVHRELGSQRQPGRWPSRVGRPSVARSCGCGEHGWLLLRKPTMRQQDRRCPPPQRRGSYRGPKGTGKSSPQLLSRATQRGGAGSQFSHWSLGQTYNFRPRLDLSFPTWTGAGTRPPLLGIAGVIAHLERGQRRRGRRLEGQVSSHWYFLVL